MRPVKSSAAPADEACAEGVERFDARDGAGRSMVIEKLPSLLHENALGGLEWSGSGASYRLAGGGVVERVNESLFRVLSTGELLRREEGKHGITHHQEHQPPSAR